MAFIGPSPRPHIDVTTSGKRALSSSVVVTTILCRDARASNIGTGTSCLKHIIDPEIDRDSLLISLRIAVLVDITRTLQVDIREQGITYRIRSIAPYR